MFNILVPVITILLNPNFKTCNFDPIKFCPEC